LTARVKIDVGGQVGGPRGQGSARGRANLIKTVCAEKGFHWQFNWVLN